MAALHNYLLLSEDSSSCGYYKTINPGTSGHYLERVHLHRIYHVSRPTATKARTAVSHIGPVKLGLCSFSIPMIDYVTRIVLHKHNLRDFLL